MSAPDRREYEKLLGREDIHYEDIYKMEYRNKIIYQDENFKCYSDNVQEEMIYE